MGRQQNSLDREPDLHGGQPVVLVRREHGLGLVTRLAVQVAQGHLDLEGGRGQFVTQVVCASGKG